MKPTFASGVAADRVGNPDVIPPSRPIPSEWLAEFEAAALRPLSQRMRYAFIHTYKPVMDDASYRSFDAMSQYREWCDRALPPWLGYHR